MSRCGHEWMAPLARPTKSRFQGQHPKLPSLTVTSLPQKCDEPQGHDGPHRSLTNVTADREDAT
jgi:hypothetical protein